MGSRVGTGVRWYYGACRELWSYFREGLATLLAKMNSAFKDVFVNLAHLCFIFSSPTLSSGKHANCFVY